MATVAAALGTTPELASLTSLAKLVGNDNIPTGAMQTSAQATNGLDVAAKRYQGISDGFKDGQLTPLTAVLKGITGQVAASKSEQAQQVRDQKQQYLDSLLQWKAQNEQQQAVVQQQLLAHQEASQTGTQLAQSLDQLAAGDESGVRNWFASNPETAKMMSQRLGVPVESATFTKLNGVVSIIPYGRGPDGAPVTGEAIPVDTLLKGYAPDAYAARYATRQQDALNQAQLQDKQLGVQKTQAEIDKLRAETDAKATPAAPKPLPYQMANLQHQTLQNIGTLGQTNQNIDGILSNINSGKLKTDILDRTVSKGLNATGSSTPQSRALADYDANIKKMVNDSLLLAKGVQTEGDAQRAADAVLAAPYDTQAVKERLIELKGINARSVQLQKLGNDQMRSEYGHDPLDYSPYEAAPVSSSSSASAPAVATPTYAVNPKTGERIMLQGGAWVPAK